MADALERIAAKLCARYITPYADRLVASGRTPLSPKEVHDPVWGTISLTPFEVAIVDSPLLQRLRHLRQLGVAHWVYPGAGHSRFEHTLGVLHQADQLISAINRSALVQYETRVIDAPQTLAVRLAALMHDVGHPVLSHVSEYALNLDPKTILEIQRYRRTVGESAKLSEIISVLIVRSAEFEGLVSHILAAQSAAGAPNPWHGKTKELLQMVGDCIVSRKISDQIPLLHQIISGPFDADKLDYMLRDAKAAGIPTIIDISRLTRKITVRRLEQAKLPPNIARNVKAGLPHYYLFGFTWSGLSVVDELLLARMILYAKLYRHPKVIAVEAMVRAFVSQLARVVSNAEVIEFVYNALDDQLILADRDDLVRWLGLDASQLDSAKDAAIDAAVDLLRRLRERDLFVRAFAFFPSEHGSSSQDGGDSPFAWLVRQLSDREGVEKLRSAVVTETKLIMSAVDPALESTAAFRNCDNLVAIMRAEPPSQEELRHAFIFPSSGPPQTFGNSGIQKDAWSSSFASAAPKGFIFSPRELAPYVFLATETVIARDRDALVPSWMAEEAKQSTDDVAALRRKLLEAGYLAGKPRYLRPRAVRLTYADAEQTVEAFAKRFATVEEFDQADRRRLDATLQERAFSWLNQFEDDELVGCALDLLKRAKLLGRNDVSGTIRAFLQKHPQFARASVVPLSAGKDSSQIVQYFVGDDPGEMEFYSSVGEAAADDRDEPVLFVDDFIGSGTQVDGIVRAWFGDQSSAEMLGEQRRLALEPEQEFLRGRELGFAFVAGWREGLKKVAQTATEFSLRVSVNAGQLDEDLPFAFSQERDQDIAPETWTRFEQRCREIGAALLANEEWPDAKRDERTLGYGNRGMLLFFPYNTPSQTLTCMWRDGDVDGAGWMPLLRRRKKT